MSARPVIFAGLLVAAAVLAARRSAAAVPDGVGGQSLADELTAAVRAAADALSNSGATIAGVVDDSFYQLSGVRVASSGRWREDADNPANRPLVNLMRDAEARYGLPHNLVVRVAWQESRFKVDAYNAASGASGVMQIVPRWHPGVDVWNPAVAIDYGAKYLAQLYKQFGTYAMALAAYNWGPGNQKNIDLANGVVGDDWPLETRNYVRDVLADLNEAGTVIA